MGLNESFQTSKFIRAAITGMNKRANPTEAPRLWRCIDNHMIATTIGKERENGPALESMGFIRNKWRIGNSLINNFFRLDRLGKGHKIESVNQLPVTQDAVCREISSVMDGVKFNQLVWQTNRGLTLELADYIGIKA